MLCFIIFCLNFIIFENFNGDIGCFEEEIKMIVLKKIMNNVGVVFGIFCNNL